MTDTIEAQVGRLFDGLRAFEAALVALDEVSFLGPLGNWTPRDVAAHLIGWNRAVVRGSKELLEGQLPFYDVDPGENFARVNAEMVRAVATTDREELLDQLHASVERLAAFLRSLDESDWKRDSGVRNQSEILTVVDTVEALVEDYSHHASQLRGLAS